MRIDPRTARVRVGDGQVQLGNGPDAVVVDVRPRGVRTLLAELAAGTHGTPAQAVPALSRRCGLPEAEVEALLDGLAPVLEHPGRQAGPPLPTAVHVDGLGPTGAAVADLLAAAGVARIGLTDGRPVVPGQLGHGLITADVGRPRAVALAQRLGERGVTAAPCPQARRRWYGTATVLVTEGAWDVDRLARAQTARHPVLPVVLRDEDTLVGPWSAPDTPGCPLCWERWAEQEDPLRAARTAALRRAEAGRETVARAHRTAGTVLETLRRGPVPGTAWRVAEAPTEVAVETLAPWPGCACGG